MKTDTMECALLWIKVIEQLQVKRIQEVAIPLQGILFSYVAFSPYTKYFQSFKTHFFFSLDYIAVSRYINNNL